MNRGLSRRHIRGLLYRLNWRLHTLRRGPKQVLAVSGLVCLVLIISWLTSAPQLRRQPAKGPAGSSHVITTSTNHPSEAPIPASYRSTATGDQPKYLNLPTIGAQGYIQAVGVDQHRQIAVPTNIHLAGWFANTVTPGDPGLSVIDGHLDGYRLPGIFASLAKLKPGDHFSVGLANGRIRNFEVKTVQSLPTDQAVRALFSQLPGISRQLNLITCGGEFNASTGYDHRLVVSASLVD